MKVMSARAVKEAVKPLAAQFTRDTGISVEFVFAPVGGVRKRLADGEAADIVILSASAIEELASAGALVPGSRRDLGRTSIGMAVRKGAAKPDISSMDTLKQTLLHAKSIAYSASASGVYLSHDLFQHFGIADQIKDKCQRIADQPVGAVVARGEAEIGFQQISELLPVPGIDYVGPLPPGAQKVTVFSAGVAASAKNPDAARALIQFFVSPANARVIADTGLEPIKSK